MAGSVAAVYRSNEEGVIAAVPRAGGVSALDACPSVDADNRRMAADYARGWYAGITADIFG